MALKWTVRVIVLVDVDDVGPKEAERLAREQVQAAIRQSQQIKTAFVPSAEAWHRA